MENSELSRANFGKFDPTSDYFRHGADLTDANLTGARTSTMPTMDIALTDGAIGLPQSKPVDN
jgi:hypothetical protein